MDQYQTDPRGRKEKAGEEYFTHNEVKKYVQRNK